ncbi:MAG: hypothetical protein KC877_04000 [Candidatus Kaiserbacteria bacterium]|nr:hypothetical protein [Candidatus Kaiserbacteria bacterium]MCB9816200.1 hypothetical protein [Candidatus Nomurabacteria bacterium]
MMQVQLFFAWLLSYLFAPIDVLLDGGGNFSWKQFKQARLYNYEVRRAHITGDWTVLNRKYETPLPDKDEHASM